MMPTKFVFHLFLGYVAFMLFGTIWLCTKYLADLADCNKDVNHDSEFPHQKENLMVDPWNVNDHPVSYANNYPAQKKKRGAMNTDLALTVTMSNGKNFLD